MWDTIKKLKYRADANIPEAKAELETRLHDRMELPLMGIHGEKLYLTGVTQLRKRAAELDLLYEKLPEHRGFQDTIILDAWSSATIEGAKTTVNQVRKSFDNPKTKDDRMVINTVLGSKYAYGRPITERNIRRLWNKVVDGVCENETQQGKLYRSGMVYIAGAGQTVHTPASPEIIPERMAQLFSFREVSEDLLIRSFVAHFYFVYIHPFCDGNGRTARILNASQLYHGGYKKMRNLPLSTAINNQLSGYYSSLLDSETVLNGQEIKWLDLSPFVSYMLDAFERCLIDAALSENSLTPRESKVLERMNKAGVHAEITASKAAMILDCSTPSARMVLNGLQRKGYLTIDTANVPHIYRLEQHYPST